MSRVSARRRSEAGASLVIFAICISILLSMVAISISYSQHVSTRGLLQNAVDEAATAAATACQAVTPASSRTDECGLSAAEAVVHTVRPDATVTTTLLGGSPSAIRVRVVATVDEKNVLGSVTVTGEKSQVAASSDGSPRPLVTTPGRSWGLTRTARMVDTGLGLSTSGNIYAWGNLAVIINGGGVWKPPEQIAVPSGTAVQVSGQIYDGNALDTSGNVWGWGSTPGRNGTDSGTPLAAPSRLRVDDASTGSGALLSNIVQISTTEQAGGAIDSGGDVWVWGLRGYGGNSGKGASRLSGLPDPSVAGNRPVYIKGAYTCLYIVLANGDVYYTGGNSSTPPGTATSYGTATELTALDPWTKAQVANGQPHVVTVDGGINMGGALLSDGTVLSWSHSNDTSRTGRDGTGIATIPTLSGIVSMQFGFTGVALLDSGETLWGYGGSDDYGRFPQTPTAIDSDVLQYSAGQGFYVWQRSDGTFWGRGYNPEGSIGLPIGQIDANRLVTFGGANSLSVVAVTGN